uniref:Uncharacterized protein n=1 Tax=Panagrolaimus sp. JU765 TaxID=591449 RepID=A0AC34R1D5_9BILA
MDENQSVLRNLMASVAEDARQKEMNAASNEKEVTATAATKVVAPPPEILMPRRDQRQFFFSPQFKRMRPCFYSPIQCLMKRSQEEA